MFVTINVRVLFFIIFSLMVSAKLSAATIQSIPLTGENKSQYKSIILIDGDIEVGDLLQFQSAAKISDADTLVFLNSDGGILKDGLGIGREIRKRGFNTLVTDVCASACALAWLGGVNRFMEKDAKVGFHLAYIDGEVKRESGAANALVGLYLGEMGYGQNVVEYVTSASPGDIQWLSLRDARLLGLNANIFNLDFDRGQENDVTISTNASSLAKEFVLKGIMIHSGPSQVALKWVQRNYTQKVFFFGKKMSLASVLREKRSYFKRWPDRYINVDYGSLNTECDNGLCIVSGIYNWSVSSRARNKSASGVSDFSYGVVLGDHLKIVGEEGKVLSRN